MKDKTLKLQNIKSYINTSDIEELSAEEVSTDISDMKELSTEEASKIVGGSAAPQSPGVPYPGYPPYRYP